ncbi:hypothetical protein [Macrococcus sp. PK]|uniref:hypothetical protein n=1 Tax=Macrococcus sp. PK TaxID=2801919 RepID=UPI001F0D186E|nr:hypothetical protein [Macrococcus sp. PK]
MAEEIKKAKKSKINIRANEDFSNKSLYYNKSANPDDLLEISSGLITDYNNNDTSKLLEYSARLNSHINNFT